MKHIKPFVVATTVISGLFSVNAQTTIFNDDFTSGSDTVQQASTPAPGANYTSFQYFQQGAAPATPVLSTGDLQLRGRTTTSSISEVQAMFTTSPVTLTTIGDWIDLTIVFKNTTNSMVGGTTSTLNVGLFNSGGIKPVQGVRLDATGSGTGGAVGWNGYVGRTIGTGNSTIYTRAAQGPHNNPNAAQDALFNGASGSATYTNLPATGIGSTAANLSSGLTSGSFYTLDYQIMFSATGVLTISNALYSGSSVNPLNLLFSEIAFAGGTTNITQTFDALALGWRYNSVSAPSAIDLSSITVTDFIQAPEPATFGIVGLGILGLVAARRFQRR